MSDSCRGSLELRETLAERDKFRWRQEPFRRRLVAGEEDTVRGSEEARETLRLDAIIWMFGKKALKIFRQQAAPGGDVDRLMQGSERSAKLVY